MGTKLSVKKVRQAIPNSKGIFANIAKQCGVQRSSVTEFLKKYPKLKDEINEEREKTIDIVENKLMEIIEKGDYKDNSTFQAIKLVLTTIGKARGFSEKQELEISNKGEGLKLIIERVDEKKE